MRTNRVALRMGLRISGIRDIRRGFYGFTDLRNSPFGHDEAIGQVGML